MRWPLSLLLFLPAVSHAQVLTGQGKAIDGDSIAMTGFDVRLAGIDAPEALQTCERGEEDWACGQEAKALLSALVDGKVLSCHQRGSDKYNRVVASCKAGRTDVAEALVRAGLAVALPQFSDEYVFAEAQAKSRGVGIWAGEFMLPADFRATNPSSAPTVRIEKQPQATTVQSSTSVYFRGCHEARAAGYAPMYRGQLGYRPGLDGDNDGIACEPYRGRR